MLAAHVGVAHPDPLGSPVDVTPAKAEQLGLAESGDSGGENQDSEDGPEHIGWRRGRRTVMPLSRGPIGAGSPPGARGCRSSAHLRYEP